MAIDVLLVLVLFGWLWLRARRQRVITDDGLPLGDGPPHIDPEDPDEAALADAAAKRLMEGIREAKAMKCLCCHWEITCLDDVAITAKDGRVLCLHCYFALTESETRMDPKFRRELTAIVNGAP